MVYYYDIMLPLVGYCKIRLTKKLKKMSQTVVALCVNFSNSLYVHCTPTPGISTHEQDVYI